MDDHENNTKSCDFQWRNHLIHVTPFRNSTRHCVGVLWMPQSLSNLRLWPTCSRSSHRRCWPGCGAKNPCTWSSNTQCSRRRQTCGAGSVSTLGVTKGAGRREGIVDAVTSWYVEMLHSRSCHKLTFKFFTPASSG